MWRRIFPIGICDFCKSSIGSFKNHPHIFQEGAYLSCLSLPGHKIEELVAAMASFPHEACTVTALQMPWRKALLEISGMLLICSLPLLRGDVIVAKNVLTRTCFPPQRSKWRTLRGTLQPSRTKVHMTNRMLQDLWASMEVGMRDDGARVQRNAL